MVSFRWSLTSEKDYQFYFVAESEKKEGQARQIRQFLTLTKDVERNNIDDDESYDGSMKWFGVDFHYHLFATILDKKEVTSSR